MYLITTSWQGDAAILQIIMLMNNKYVLCQSFQADATPCILFHESARNPDVSNVDHCTSWWVAVQVPMQWHKSKVICRYEGRRGGGGGEGLRSWNAVTCCSVSNQQQHKRFSRSRRCSNAQCLVAQIASRLSVPFLLLLSAKSWFFGGLLCNVFQNKVVHVQTEDYHNRKLWCKTTCKKVQQSHYRPGQTLLAVGG
jgi:hypothetical protein